MSRQSYTTLSEKPATPTSSTYHDRDSLPFQASYPIVYFDEKIFIDEGCEESTLETYLLHNFWYQKANSILRKRMLDRVVHVNANLSIILDFIRNKYGKIGLECTHISIAGSFIYSEKPGDLDLDVVIEGSFFDYSYFNEGVELIDTMNSISKISLTVMGSDNISGKSHINSNIENEGFIHQDTILREIIVAPMRNVTVYGHPIDYSKSVVNNTNVIARVARQLYFASLTLQGKIPYYNQDPLKTKKALSRINEAHDILEWLYLSTSSEPTVENKSKRQRTATSSKP